MRIGERMMKRAKFLFAALALLLFCLACPSANAGIITYNVDISGFSDTNLSVIGTITYDTHLQKITTSSLQIYDPTLISPNLPTTTIPSPNISPFANGYELNPAAWQWNATSSALYFDPQPPNNTFGYVQWYNPTSGYDFILEALPSANGGGVQVEVANLPAGDFSYLNFDSSGFLVGTPQTTPVVPEPGSLSLFLVGGISLAGYAWRRRGRIA
jgi:hypothetical protein